MRNPLFRRYPRELRNNMGKYLGLFLMMVFAVSFTSGFLLAAGSIERIIDDMKEAYRIEDGRFICDFEPSDVALDAVRDLGVTLYPDFYKQVSLTLGDDMTEATDEVADKDANEGADSPTDAITVRVYPNRCEVNLPAYAQGRAPESADEVAIDRVFCENHHLQVGDVVALAGKNVTVSGIMTLPDYQALFEDNNSFMFNALTFAVAQVSEQGYKDLGRGGEVYTYAFTFDDPSLSRVSKTSIEEDMVEALADNDALLSDLIDADDNQGIGYALDDAQGDQAMWLVLLMLLVVIMGFVFVVLTGTTIEQESAVIGTLLASGWRKRELVSHYLLLPAVIGLVAACVGLALGVFVLCDPFKDLYYHSYSLPPYHTIWSWRIVVLTAVVPYMLLVGITLLGLVRSLRFTPLQFLRHEVSSHKRRGRLRLPAKIRYATRFRLRLLMRNAGNFVTLFFGIMFASLLLLFGLCMLPVVDNYAQALRETVVSPHQYVLKTPVELEGTDEERDRYAAALRVAEDNDRVEANRSAVDALERLEDKADLVDALQRLQDDTELTDALDRLQDDDELVDVMRRLRGDQELMDAAERLQDKAQLIDAAQRLQTKQDLVAAAQRLQDKQEYVAAAQRLSTQLDLVAAVTRLQSQPLLISAAQHVQEGTANVIEFFLLASASSQTQADLELASSLDDQTQADMTLMQNVDAQTKADMQMLADLDEQTQVDMQLVAEMDEQTRADIQRVSGADEQTRSDLEYVSNLDESTRADLDLITRADGQTKADLELLMDLDDATRADLDLARSMDDDLMDDLRLVADIDEDAHVVNTQPNQSAAVATAEKYAMASMEIERALGGEAETITVYGIQPNSVYWTEVPVQNGVAVAGRGLVEKTKATVGKTATIHNPRKGVDYRVRIAEETENKADTALYLTLDDFNRLFGNDADYFNAYAARQELKIDERYLSSSIVPEDMDDISKQMRESMGKIMYLMMLMAVPIYLILIYLLTKTVIDRSARSISYMKVFGYHEREVDGLYIRPISVFVLVSLVMSIPLIIALMNVLLTLVFMRYSGNFPILIPASRLALLVVVGMIVYAVVAFLHVRRIRRVPLSLALKVQE